MKEGIEKAITAAGGEQQMLGDALGVTKQFINTSLRKGYLPLDKAKVAADLYGIPLIELVRSDIADAMRRQS